MIYTHLPELPTVLYPPQRMMLLPTVPPVPPPYAIGTGGKLQVFSSFGLTT